MLPKNYIYYSTLTEKNNSQIKFFQRRLRSLDCKTKFHPFCTGYEGYDSGEIVSVHLQEGVLYFSLRVEGDVVSLDYDKKAGQLVLEAGRPGDCSDRLEKEIRVYDLLDALGVTYQRIDHEAAMTMDACAEIDRVLQAVICKNLFLCNRQETDFYLLVIPGEKPFKTKYLSAQIGSSRLSFAKPEYMERFLDITPGSVSIMGLMNDTENKVQLLIDEDVLTGEYIGFHPCINTSSIKLRMQDLMEKVIPAMHHEPRYVSLPRV